MNTSIVNRAMYQRKNPLTATLLKMIYDLTSIPKIMLEVFTRHSFGERYFSLFTCIVGVLLLAWLPYTFPTTDKFPFEFWSMVGNNFIWYLYLMGFLALAIIRNVEISRQPSVFDFAKFSLFQGFHQPWFEKLVLERIPIKSKRAIDIWIEPGFFLLVGIVIFTIINPFLGIWIIFSAFCYSIANSISYYQGDHYIMDIIDGIIRSMEFEKVFVNDASPEESRCFDHKGRRPVDGNLRQTVADVISSSNEVPTDKNGDPINFEELPKTVFDKNGRPSFNFFAHAR